jgi:hypothetical protein
MMCGCLGWDLLSSLQQLHLGLETLLLNLTRIDPSARFSVPNTRGLFPGEEPCRISCLNHSRCLHTFGRLTLWLVYL